MRSFKSVKVVQSVFAVLFMLTISVFTQDRGCKSRTVEGRVACANMIVEFAAIASDRLQGRIDWPGNGPVRIEVYKVKRSDRKRDSYRLTDEHDPVLIFETDEEGRFCHPGLEDGFYVVRFGTQDGGWNCTWIKVRIAKGIPRSMIRASLEIGI